LKSGIKLAPENRAKNITSSAKFHKTHRFLFKFNSNEKLQTHQTGCCLQLFAERKNKYVF